jgi:hypothetical protein
MPEDVRRLNMEDSAFVRQTIRQGGQPYDCKNREFQMISNLGRFVGVVLGRYDSEV